MPTSFLFSLPCGHSWISVSCTVRQVTFLQLCCFWRRLLGWCLCLRWWVVESLTGDIPENTLSHEPCHTEKWSLNLVGLPDSSPHLCRWDDTDHRLIVSHEHGVVFREVRVALQLSQLLVAAFATEDNKWHLLDHTLSILPQVQRFDKVAAHNEMHRVCLLVLQLQLI